MSHSAPGLQTSWDNKSNQEHSACDADASQRSARRALSVRSTENGPCAHFPSCDEQTGQPLRLLFRLKTKTPRNEPLPPKTLQAPRGRPQRPRRRRATHHTKHTLFTSRMPLSTKVAGIRATQENHVLVTDFPLREVRRQVGLIQDLFVVALRRSLRHERPRTLASGGIRTTQHVHQMLLILITIQISNRNLGALHLKKKTKCGELKKAESYLRSI